MDRRSFLRRTAIGGGAVVAAGGGALGLRRSGALPEPRSALSVLDAPSFGLLALVAARIVPHADPLTIAHDADLALLFAPPEAREDLKLALGILQNSLAGLLTRGSPKLFSELAPEEQDAALDRWLDSRVPLLRGASSSLRKLCLGVHYGLLENARAIGYPGPPFDKPEPPPIEARAPLSPPFLPAKERK